jgi:hypothetical protein
MEKGRVRGLAKRIRHGDGKGRMKERILQGYGSAWKESVRCEFVFRDEIVNTIGCATGVTRTQTGA